MAIKLHFLNVGHGDCTIVEFPSGRLMMVDINNSKALDEESENELINHFRLDSLSYRLQKLTGSDPFVEKGYDIKLTDPIDYYKSNWGSRALFRFVCTHPDMDHISGLHRLYKQEQIDILNFWDSEHNFSKSDEEFENQNKYDKNDWHAYQEIRQSENMPKVLWLERHVENQFYADDGIYLLAPTKELKKLAHKKDDPNHLSYVLMVKYGKSKIILGGDATVDVWQDIYDEFGEDFLNSSVLQASHHGRESGFHEDAVKAISPIITTVSVGKKPSTDASNKYRAHSKYVWSTRWKGNIILTCHEDGQIEYEVEYDR